MLRPSGDSQDEVAMLRCQCTQGRIVRAASRLLWMVPAQERTAGIVGRWLAGGIQRPMQQRCVDVLFARIRVERSRLPLGFSSRSSRAGWKVPQQEKFDEHHRNGYECKQAAAMVCRRHFMYMSAHHAVSTATCQLDNFYGEVWALQLGWRTGAVASKDRRWNTSRDLEMGDRATWPHLLQK